MLSKENWEEKTPARLDLRTVIYNVINAVDYKHYKGGINRNSALKDKRKSWFNRTFQAEKMTF